MDGRASELQAHQGRFHNPCDGMRSARLNLLEAFSQAMIAVNSTSASSS